MAGIAGLSWGIAILYFGRSILVPLTVAVFLSFIVAPLIRFLRRTGLNRTFSTLLSVSVLSVVFGALTLTIINQVVHLASSLSQYQDNLEHKSQAFQEVTSGRITPALKDAEKLLAQLSGRPGMSSRTPTPAAKQRLADRLPDGDAQSPLPVEIHEPPPTPMEILRSIGTSIAGPLETAFIIFIVCVFVLLDQEGLRDRFIRLIGNDDLRRTTAFMDDAGKRLSRYFLSQFSVNASMGALVAIGLSIVGTPSAVLLGALTAVLRFVPYIGVWIAALLAAGLAAAVDPGWSLAITAIGLFAILEAFAGQVVEPLLYGHTTGLSPVSVILAAVFWAGIWGPIGLILSTPLTLCLVVLGRYIGPLKFFDILLGDTPGLRLHQQFYQRVLAGDAQEIVANGRMFLKTKSFIEYCDAVVVPAIQLASSDESDGTISDEQRRRAGATAVHAIQILSGEVRLTPFWKRPKSVLNSLEPTPIELLKASRERRYQGSSGTVSEAGLIKCIGLSTQFDGIAIELLIRALEQHQMDARHLSPADLTLPALDGREQTASTIVLVCIDLSTEVTVFQELVSRVRQTDAEAKLISIFRPSFFADSRKVGPSFEGVNFQAASFEEAVRECVTGKRMTDGAQTP